MKSKETTLAVKGALPKFQLQTFNMRQLKMCFPNLFMKADVSKPPNETNHLSFFIPLVMYLKFRTSLPSHSTKKKIAYGFQLYICSFDYWHAIIIYTKHSQNTYLAYKKRNKQISNSDKQSEAPYVSILQLLNTIYVYSTPENSTTTRQSLLYSNCIYRSLTLSTNISVYIIGKEIKGCVYWCSRIGFYIN